MENSQAEVSPSRLRYISSTVQLQYTHDEGFFARVQAKVKEQNDSLNLNQHASNDRSLVFQSLTGSTVVTLQEYQATLQTNYFDQFIEPDHGEFRRDYGTRKLETLFQILAHGEAKILFFGIVVIARLPLPRRESARPWQSRMARLFNLTQLVSGSSALYDANIRVSRSVNQLNAFTSLSVHWFESRRIVLSATEIPSGPLHDWQFPISETGIEMRIDNNNKLGLTRNIHDWKPTDCIAIAEDAHERSIEEFKSFLAILRDTANDD